MQCPESRPETRYGMPLADLVLFNRHYVLGYSYCFRQAKWALEIVDPDKSNIGRVNSFRPDYRILEAFRADLAVYERSGYDRGHLVASANQKESKIQNSETFLLSNMSPQNPSFNRNIWKQLEDAIRKLDGQKRVLETYVICGPIFYFNQNVETITAKNNKGVTLPIPHAYFKSVLTENSRGVINMWSFIMGNVHSDEPLESFLVPTTKVEQYAGINLWQGLTGTRMNREKKRVRKMWKV